MRAVVKANAECGEEVWADDGIQFYAGLLLLSQCAALVGLQISNVAMAAAELMATQARRRRATTARSHQPPTM
jgi:hypothetical protein